MRQRILGLGCEIHRRDPRYAHLTKPDVSRKFRRPARWTICGRGAEEGGTIVTFDDKCAKAAGYRNPAVAMAALLWALLGERHD
jgi:hypothetical protein